MARINYKIMGICSLVDDMVVDAAPINPLVKPVIVVRVRGGGLLQWANMLADQGPGGSMIFSSVGLVGVVDAECFLIDQYEYRLMPIPIPRRFVPGLERAICKWIRRAFKNA